MVVPTENLITCLTGSADDLSGYMPIRTTSTWDYDVGPLRCGLVRGLFRRQQCCGLIAGKWCGLLLLQRVCYICYLLLLHRPLTHHAGVHSG